MTTTHSTQRAAQVAEIERALTVMFEPGDVVELRILYGRNKRVDFGFFNDFHKLAEVAAQLDNAKNPAPSGVYVTMNRIQPDLLARAENAIERAGSGDTTADKDVTALRWLLLDADPSRVSGVSSTDAELRAATRKAAQVEAWLTSELSWPAPLRAPSGNGAHRLYQIDLPNTPENVDLVKRCLAALAARFDDDAVKIDTTVFNPGRIVKLYGTTARKGSDTDERPHRRAELTHAPDPIQVVTVDQLRTLAEMAPKDTKTPSKGKTTPTKRTKSKDTGEYWKAGSPDAVEAWAAGHGLELRAKSGDKWEVDCLTCNGAHSAGAALFLTPEGYLRYKCLHNSCSNATIADVFAKYPAPERPQKERKGKASTGKDDELLSERIEQDVISWGYRFWLNDLDDTVWNGDKRFDDVQAAELRILAYDAGYGEDGILGALDAAVVAMAAMKRRHPLREYLSGLTWDGQDHIGKLVAYFTEKHDPIVYADGTKRRPLHAFLIRWLAGSVAKIHGDKSAALGNFVLTLAGSQDLGKSHLAHWLCPLDDYFVEQSVHPDSKDSKMRRITTWVWEIGELGATTRRADVEALKAFLTAASVTERKAYGRFDITKPAIASYIGTVNDDGSGFLADQTGNRRFVVIDLTAIDWAYSTEVNPVQVWAQAVAMWRENPKAYALSKEERDFRDRNNENHAEHDPIADMIDYCLEEDKGAPIPLRSTRILEVLRTYGGLSRGSDKAQSKDIARALRKYWRIEGRRSNGATWFDGLKLRDWITTDETTRNGDEMAGAKDAEVLRRAGV